MMNNGTCRMSAGRKIKSGIILRIMNTVMKVYTIIEASDNARMDCRVKSNLVNLIYMDSNFNHPSVANGDTDSTRIRRSFGYNFNWFNHNKMFTASERGGSVEL